MDLETLLGACPDYAKDLKLNLQSVLRQTELTEQQLWGTAVAAALASRNGFVTEALLAEAGKHLAPAAMQAAKAAAAVMGMNNVYYRFQHLTQNPKYGSMPARLRMHALRTHGSDPVDFELWCLAVSAIHACPGCVSGHEAALREKGVGEEPVLAAVRIASVVHALAGVMDTERPNVT